MKQRVRTSFPGGVSLTPNQARMLDATRWLNRLIANESVLVERTKIAAGLGEQYGDSRDVYTALGWKKNLQFADFKNRYDRQDIASRIVDAFPDATWRGKPDVRENEDEEETAWEKAWQAMVQANRVYHYLTRADKLAGIGEYSVVYLGFDDVSADKPEEPVEKAQQLLFIRVFSQDNATVDELEGDTSSPRFGLPKYYKLNIAKISNMSSSSLGGTVKGISTPGSTRVHWTRCLHIADDLLENEVFGTPKLQKVINDLFGLELVVGGAAEFFWRGANKDLALELEPGAELSTTDLQNINTELDEYFHNLRRVLRLQGGKVKSLAPSIVNPEPTVDTILKLISGATKIPVRILTGSERGELASSQDQENWNNRVAERREDFADPMVLRPFIGRMVEVGVLEEPAGGVDTLIVDWPDVDALSEKDQAEINKMKTEVMAKYLQAGGEHLIPRLMFMEKFLNLTKEEATSAAGEVEALLQEEAAEEAAWREAQAAALAEAEKAKQLGKTEEVPAE